MANIEDFEEGEGRVVIRMRQGWLYVKVGTTEMRGRQVAGVGFDVEQVSHSYDLEDLDEAVEIMRKRFGED